MGYARVCWENQIRATYVTVNRQRNVGHTRAESLCRRKWSVVAGMVWAGEGKNCP